MEDVPIDCPKVIEQYCQEEFAPSNPVHSAEKHSSPRMIGGYVDYQAAVKKWD